MNTYNRRLDRLITHDWPGTHGNHMVNFVMDEIELGARVALAIDDPEQWWWELIGNDLLEADMWEFFSE